MPPSLAFRGQPFENEDRAGAFLERVLSDQGTQRVSIVAAWAKWSGLRRFQPEFEAFRARGGHVRIIVGIDEGGATRPGLVLAIQLSDEAFVFHDNEARTFHPKLYLAEGDKEARLLVGSSNLTAGGLESNYEASLEAGFTLPQEESEAALVDAKKYVRMLLEDEQLCQPLDEELLDRLIRDGRYRIAISERRRTQADKTPEGLAADDLDEHGESGEEEGEPIFGSSRHSKNSARRLSADARAELRELEGEDEEAGPSADGTTVPPPATPPPGPPPPGPPPVAPSPPVQTVESWSKELPASDAQHPPSTGSNPLGNVRLTKAGHTIDWLTYFRQRLFGPAAWVTDNDRQGNPIEVVTIPFEVTINGVSHGTVPLKVDHAPHRESGQANHATVLHLGALLPTMRAADYTGYTLTLERRSDGTYTFDISP